MWEFEFDTAKSALNQEKHGIDFVRAQELWLDEDLLMIPARTEGENRYLVIGQLDGCHWSAVITFRSGRVRLISVRRARPREVQEYEGL